MHMGLRNLRRVASRRQPKGEVAVDQEIERGVDPDTLIEHPDNPRKSDDVLIEAMIRKHGWYGTVTVQRSTRYVVAGNGRIRAARRIGIPVDVTWRDLTDDEAREILLGDNRASDLGGYDDEALIALLQEMADGPGLEGTGYDDNDLALLVANLGQDGYGTAKDGETPQERQALYDAADIRTIVLPFTSDRYDEVVRQLGAVRLHLDLESFADVVSVLAAQAMAEIATDP